MKTTTRFALASCLALVLVVSLSSAAFGFGIWQIGDYVWEDLNYDGIQNDGDTGIEGVTVQLWVHDSSSGDHMYGDMQTDATGAYLFDCWNGAGEHYVVFLCPAGYEFTHQDQGSDDLDSDADPTTGQTISFVAQNGNKYLTWDAGLFRRCAIGDYVWEDINGDGIQDDGEPGIADVQVDLCDGDDNVLDTTYTDASGYYLFADLTPGEYHVQFTAPDGYRFTQQDQGADDALDSDADASTGATATTFLISGEEDMTWDAGLYRPAAIGDYVWHDLNANGIQDEGEPGIADVAVELHDGAGGLVGSKATDGSGLYLFNELAPGDYSLKFAAPTGYLFSPQDQGGDTADSDADTTTGQTVVTALISDETDLTWDAGLFMLASLGDFVWQDLDEDGIQDAGEDGIEGVQVDLYDGEDAFVASDTTDASGIYGFEDLMPGDYSVKFTAPGGYLFSPQDQGGDDALDSDADTATGQTAVTTLISDETDLTWDAGLYEPEEPQEDISLEKTGVKVYYGGECRTPGYWKNHSDAWPVEQISIGGVTYSKAEAIDIMDSPTRGDMRYVMFAHLVAAKLNVLSGTDPAPVADTIPAADAWMQTYGPPGQGPKVTGDSDAWAEGEPLKDRLDAYNNGNLTGGGDPQGSNIWVGDKIEFTITIRASLNNPRNVTVWDYLDSCLEVLSVDNGGQYVASGHYVMWEVTLPAGDSLTELKFRAKVLGLPGGDNGGGGAGGCITSNIVQLPIYKSRSASRSASVAGAPEYGSRCHDVETLENYATLCPGEEMEDLISLEKSGVKVCGCGSDHISVGDKIEFTITIRASLDQPRDVTVWDYLDSCLEVLSVDNGGQYVASGHYVVWEVALPAGQSVTELKFRTKVLHLPNGDNGGGPEGCITSNIVQLLIYKPRSHSAAAAAGSEYGSRCHTTGTLENYATLCPSEEEELAALGDYVWEDTNQNGIQDGPEVGIAGVTVELYDHNADLVETATTDGSGNYLFEELAAGDYFVKFIARAGYLFSPQDQGGNDEADSDADVSTGQTATITLAAGDTDLSCDAGLYEESEEPSGDVTLEKSGIKAYGNCKTIGFWKNNVKKHLEGKKKGFQVSKKDLLRWLRTVRGFYRSKPFRLGGSDTRILKAAYKVLSYSGSNTVKKTKRQLLACELNLVSGQYALSDASAHAAFCKAVEDALNTSGVSQRKLRKLHNLCNWINNSGNRSQDPDIHVGDRIIYTITVTVNLSAPGTIQVRDLLDSCLKVIFLDNGGQLVGGNLAVWQLDLPAGLSTTKLHIWAEVESLPNGDHGTDPGTWTSNTVELQIHVESKSYAPNIIHSRDMPPPDEDTLYNLATCEPGGD